VSEPGVAEARRSSARVAAADPVKAACAARAVRAITVDVDRPRRAVQGRIARLAFSGNRELSDAALREGLPIREGEAFEEGNVAAATRHLYATHGLDDVTVDVVQASADSLELTFAIGERPIIDHLYSPRSLDKNAPVDQLDARVIVPGGRLDRGRLDAVLRATRQQYEDDGYLHADLTAHVLETTAGHVDVCILTAAGPRLLVDGIRIVGAAQVPESELRAALAGPRAGLRSGEPYRPDAVRLGLMRMNKAYLDHGYLNVDIAPPQTREAGTAIDIEVRVVEGPLFHVGDYRIEGASAALRARYEALRSLKRGDVVKPETVDADIERMHALEGASVTLTQDRDERTATIDLVVKVSK
jgi:outer membrane protein assembly factor BamA